VPRFKYLYRLLNFAGDNEALFQHIIKKAQISVRVLFIQQKKKL